MHMEKKRVWKYGSYAVLMTLVVLGIFFIVALLIRNVDWKIDMTQNHIYSLSQQTKDVLGNLKDDIKVYVFYIKNREDQRVDRLLNTYKKYSAHLKIEYIDVLKNPERIKQYSDIYLDAQYDANPVSVVFESPKRVKVINHTDMISSSNGQAEFEGEQKFTNAIRYISIEKLPVIYYIQGHREPSADKFALQSELLKKENYNVNPLNLLTEKKIPTDADIILDVSPQSAFMPEEVTEIKRYVNNGGKAVFFIDPPIDAKQDVSALKEMIKEWGIEVQEYIAVEGTQNRTYQNAVWILPQIQNHNITEPIISAGLNILVPYSRTFKTNNKNGFTVESLLKTSSNSWGKLEIKANKLGKEKGDITGPLDLAVTASKQISDKTGKKIGETRIIVAGSSSAINENVLQNPGNYDFFLNIFGWVKGETNEITIRPKPSLYSSLTMNNTQRVVTILIVLIFIPLAILIAGLLVWTRRKHL